MPLIKTKLKQSFIKMTWFGIKWPKKSRYTVKQPTNHKFAEFIYLPVVYHYNRYCINHKYVHPLTIFSTLKGISYRVIPSLPLFSGPFWARVVVPVRFQSLGQIDTCGNYSYHGLVSRVFANGTGDQGSIPGQVIPKTKIMVLDASWLNTQHYKVQIKCKV